jgi:hypothetical protein
VLYSSPTAADLGGGLDAVFGDDAGHVYALQINNRGSEVAGWPARVPYDLPVVSTPSVSGTTVFVGTGDVQTYGDTNGGGYLSLNGNGTLHWYHAVPITPGSPDSAPVYSGIAVGNLEGQTDVFAGPVAQQQWALDAATGTTLPGWPFLSYDSNFSTSDLAPVEGSGTQIVEGGDITGNAALGFKDGGFVRVLSGSGRQICSYYSNETIDSSPAVGRIFGNGVGIVVGTGFDFPDAGQRGDIIGIDANCGHVWEDKLDGDTGGTGGGPALVDALGNGGLQVAEGTSAGSLYLLNAATGSTIWRASLGGAIYGTPVSTDLGGGYQDLVVATTNGIDILDGKTGNVVAQAFEGTAFSNSPLITADANGTIGITVAGGNLAAHLEVAGSSGSRINEAGSWPSFHKDSQLTGNAISPPNPRVPCSAPPKPYGYTMVASDGGVFSYGGLPFCGSTGGIPLSRPVLGIAETSDGGGYWLVASDGGIFTFGDAHFYGSTGGISLSRPVVGMAATPDGRGYWLVASDGGIFTFGDAHFYGSTGGVVLNKPVVAMTTPRLPER